MACNVGLNKSDFHQVLREIMEAASIPQTTTDMFPCECSKLAHYLKQAYSFSQMPVNQQKGLLKQLEVIQDAQQSRMENPSNFDSKFNLAFQSHYQQNTSADNLATTIINQSHQIPNWQSDQFRNDAARILSISQSLRSLQLNSIRSFSVDSNLTISNGRSKITPEHDFLMDPSVSPSKLRPFPEPVRTLSDFGSIQKIISNQCAIYLSLNQLSARVNESMQGQSYLIWKQIDLSYCGSVHLQTGRPSGFGKIRNRQDQVVCEAEWFQGLLHGHTILHFEKKQYGAMKFVSKFVEGYPRGFGRLSWEGGTELDSGQLISFTNHTHIFPDQGMAVLRGPYQTEFRWHNRKWLQNSNK